MRQNAAGPATAATNEAVWQYLPAVGTPEWAVNPSWTDYSADDCAQGDLCWVAQQAGDERRVFSTNELVGGYVGSSGHPNVTTNAPYEWFDKNMFTGIHRAVRRSSSSSRSPNSAARDHRHRPPVTATTFTAPAGRAAIVATRRLRRGGGGGSGSGDGGDGEDSAAAAASDRMAADGWRRIAAQRRAEHFPEEAERAEQESEATAARAATMATLGSGDGGESRGSGAAAAASGPAGGGGSGGAGGRDDRMQVASSHPPQASAMRERHASNDARLIEGGRVLLATSLDAQHPSDAGFVYASLDVHLRNLLDVGTARMARSGRWVRCILDDMKV